MSENNNQEQNKKEEVISLVKQLNSEKPLDRANAVKTLGEIARKGNSKLLIEVGALPPIIMLIRSPEHEPRKQALLTLEEIINCGYAENAIDVGALLVLANELVYHDTTSGYCFFKEALRVMRLLAGNDWGKAVVKGGGLTGLIHHLSSSNAFIIHCATEELGLIAQNGHAAAIVKAKGIPALLKILTKNYADETVKEKVFETIKEITAREQVDAVVAAGAVSQFLRPLEEEKNETVRKCAAEALYRIGEANLVTLKEYYRELLQFEETKILAHRIKGLYQVN